MATQQKIYTISIQMDAAQQALDAAIKKLASLDKQLEGVNRDGAIGKGLVTEMAAAAAEVDKLTGKVQGFEKGLDALVPLVPGSVGALRQEVQALEVAIESGVVGSKELADMMQQLGAKKSELRELANVVNAANPRAQARAFGVLSGALTGVVGIATSAAQVFGLSSDTAQKYAAKMQALVGVLYSVESINKALNGENLALIKTLAGSAKAWLGFGTAAEGAGRTTRAALLSTGIGILIVAVGLLVANFDKVKAVGEEIYQKFKPQFDAIGAVIGFVIDRARDLAHFLTFGLVDSASEHAIAVAQEAREKQLAEQATTTARLLDILKARGDDTLALEVANAKRVAESLAKLGKQRTDEEEKAYQDAIKDYLVLQAQFEKRKTDELNAQAVARLSGLAAIEAAGGKANFKQQLAAKYEQLAQLLTVDRVNEAQVAALQAEIQAAQDAHEKELADKRRALLSARLDAELVVIQAKTTQQSLIALEANAKEMEITRQTRANLLAEGQVNAAAVVAADAALYKLRIARSRIFYQQEAEEAQVGHQIYLRGIEDLKKKELERETRAAADANRAQAAGARVTKQIADELAADLQQKAITEAYKADIAGNLLMRLFGISDAQAQKLKAQLVEFAEQASTLASNLLDTATQAADARLTETQATLQAATQQLTDAQSAANDTVSKLETASGARRDYLLKKLQDERAETNRLSATKAAAAKAEAAAEKEKQKLTKETTQLTLASALAATIATGAKSVEAAVGVIAGASDLGYPANIIAIISGLAVVTTAILQARNLGKSFATGGYVEGPRHAQGGIQMWHQNGAHLGEMEGGEYVVNRRATAANRPLLEMINQAASIRVLPSQAGRFAAGGVVPSLPPGMVAVSQADLSALVTNTSVMVTHLQSINAHTFNTANSNQLIAEKPPIVPDHETAIAYEQKAKEARASQQTVTL